MLFPKERCSWLALTSWVLVQSGPVIFFFLGSHEDRTHDATSRMKLYEAKCCLGLWLIRLKTTSVKKAAKKVPDFESTIKKWKRPNLLFLDFFCPYLSTMTEGVRLKKLFFLKSFMVENDICRPWILQVWEPSQESSVYF